MWEAPIKDFNSLHKDSAKFVFECAEKRLKHLLEVSDRTTNRAIAIVTALIPLTAFLLTTLYKHYFGGTENALQSGVIFVIWCSILVCLLCLFILSVVIFPRNMHQMGREPNKLFVRELLENEDYKDELQYKLYLVAESEDLQNRIEFMQIQSNSRVRTFKWVLLSIALYSTLLFVIVTLLAIQ